MLKKFPSDRMNLFFVRELQLIIVLLLIWKFYLAKAPQDSFLENCVWDFSSSIPFHFCESLYFCLTKCMDSLTFKPYNSSQN